MGEGQTKRQIVGSLDMSSSLHQTKEIHRKTLLFFYHKAEVAALNSELAFLTPVYVYGRLLVAPLSRF